MADLIDFWLFFQLHNNKSSIHLLNDPTTSSDRLAKLRKWLEIKTINDISNQRVLHSISFIREIWDSPYFFPFISIDEATSIISQAPTKYIIRLSTNDPHKLTITFYAPEWNDIRHARFCLLDNKHIILDNPYFNYTNTTTQFNFNNFISLLTNILSIKTKQSINPIPYINSS